MGLTSGEQVLFVAGHRATWALALAKAGAKVTYSDVSRELTGFVKDREALEKSGVTREEDN